MALSSSDISSLSGILVYLYFSIALVAIIYVFVRVLMRLDPSMITISLLYLLSFFLRFPLLGSLTQKVNYFVNIAHSLI